MNRQQKSDVQFLIRTTNKGNAEIARTVGCSAETVAVKRKLYKRMFECGLLHSPYQSEIRKGYVAREVAA